MRNPFMSEPTTVDLARVPEPLRVEILALAEHIAHHEPLEGAPAPRAYLVGGFVRDILLGLQPKDADLEVYGVTPEALETILRDRYLDRVISVGRSFGILKIRIDDYDLDVAIPRHESKTGPGHRGFSMHGDPTMSLHEAARRRDFTINAIFADPLTGDIIDPVNGLADLEAKLLRVVDPTTFGDDPLRVYRALQFVARFGLTVEAETETLLRTMVLRGTLTELPTERITDEMTKLLVKGTRPSLGLELARHLGIIERTFPELYALINTPQEPEWHPEGDVWTHTLMVTDQAALIRDRDQWTPEEKLQVMVAALCHDLGKPATTEHLDGRIRSRGHEEAGAEPALQFCRHFTFPDHVRQAAIISAREHLKPRILYIEHERGIVDDTQYANAVRRLLKRIAPVSYRVLLAASESDMRGRGVADALTRPFVEGSFMHHIIQREHLEEAAREPLLRGAELMERFRLSPGPQLGAILKLVEDERDAGTIRTHDEAINFVETYLTKNQK